MGSSGNYPPRPTEEIIQMVRERLKNLDEGERKAFLESILAETDEDLGWKLYCEWRDGLDEGDRNRVVAWVRSVSPRWTG